MNINSIFLIFILIAVYLNLCLTLNTKRQKKKTKLPISSKEWRKKVDIFEKNDLNSAQEKFNVKSEALKALEVLGFSKSKSEKVVNEIYFNDQNIELQKLIKKSLNKL